MEFFQELGCISETCAHLLKWDRMRGLDSEIFSASLSALAQFLERGWGPFRWTRTGWPIPLQGRDEETSPIQVGKAGPMGMPGAFFCSRPGREAGARCSTGALVRQGQGQGHRSLRSYRASVEGRPTSKERRQALGRVLPWGAGRGPRSQATPLQRRQ